MMHNGQEKCYKRAAQSRPDTVAAGIHEEQQWLR